MRMSPYYNAAMKWVGNTGWLELWAGCGPGPQAERRLGGLDAGAARNLGRVGRLSRLEPGAVLISDPLGTRGDWNPVCRAFEPALPPSSCLISVYRTAALFGMGKKIPAARKLGSGKCFIWNLGRAKAAVQKMDIPCFLSGICANRGICPNDIQAIPKQHPGGLRAVSGTALRVFHHVRDAHGKNSKAARATLTPRL